MGTCLKRRRWNKTFPNLLIHYYLPPTFVFSRVSLVNMKVRCDLYWLRESVNAKYPLLISEYWKPFLANCSRVLRTRALTYQPLLTENKVWKNFLYTVFLERRRILLLTRDGSWRRSRAMTTRSYSLLKTYIGISLLYRSCWGELYRLKSQVRAVWVN